MAYKDRATANAAKKAYLDRQRAEDPDFHAKRSAKARSRYARLKAEDPEWAERQRKKEQDKRANVEGYAEQKRAAFKAWWDNGGKEKTREKNGSQTLEERYRSLEEKRAYKREYMREWNKTEQGRRARVERSIKKRCGLTIEEYDAVYDAQQGKCRICGVEKERYAVGRLVVDHCHATGKFRALLCTNCNSAIGNFREDPAILHNAIAYLQEACRLE